MLRSNSPSCSHESSECKCASASSFFERKVISDPARENWNKVAISLIFLLMHGALVFKLSGADLSECMRPAKRLCFHLKMTQEVVPMYPVARYIKPAGSDAGAIQNDTYGGIKRYWADDIVGNLIQNVGQLVGKYISEWINGPCAEIVGWLMSTIETLVKIPGLVFHSLHSVAYHSAAFPLEETSPLGKPMANAIKGGLTAGAGMLAHTFAPCVGGAYGGIMLGYVGEALAYLGLAYYSCIGVLLIAQLLYLLMLAASQSLFVVLHMAMCPIVFVCGANKKAPGLATVYMTHWLELALWMMAWTAMLSSLRFVLFFDINPFYKIALSSVILQLMIFTPSFLSILNLSPISKYLVIDPIRGIATGVYQLMKNSVEMHKEFKTPR